MALTTKDLWAQYVNGMQSAQGMPGADNLVITGSAMPANLNTEFKIPKGKKTKKAEAAFQVFSLADPLASNQGLYKPSDQNFFSDYATYIDNLNPKGAKDPTDEQKKKMASDKTALEDATKAYSSDLTSAVSDFEKQSKIFPDKWSSFSEWLVSSPSSSVLQNDQTKIAGASTTLTTLMNSIYGKDYVAIDANRKIVDQVRADLTAKSPQSAAEMEVMDGLKNKYVKPAYTIGDLGVYSKWVENALKRTKPVARYDFSETAGQYDFSKSTYFSRQEWSEDYFFYSRSGVSVTSRTEVKMDTSSSALSGYLQFMDITQVGGILPGPWYDSSLMYEWGEGATGVTGFSTPYQLTIAVKPEIHLQLSSANYASALSAFEKEGSFGVGAFWVYKDSSRYSETDVKMQAEWNSASNSITIKQDGDQPVIIAMGMKEVKKGGIGG